uniref:cytochrome P450 81Q32-like n=1 Tax=Erigeron canadensis TaxID=72917 RepID=UPI001CB8F405|nr:cytochrome P450 81Q32-like [Erigeron canadensis]
MAIEVNIIYICIPVLVVLYLLTKHVSHKLQNLPPTPFPELPLIGHLHLVKKPLHRELAKISDHHGKVLFLRFGSRRVLHVASPSATEECLSKNDIIFANRPHLFSGKYFGYNYTSLPWAPYGEHWQNLRRISAIEILSSKRLDSLSHIRLEEIQSLTRRLFLTANKNPDEILNVRAELFGFMFNVMTRMMAGKTYFGLGSEKLAEAKRFRDMVADTAKVNVQSAMADMLPILRWFVGGKLDKRYKAVQKRRDDFMQEWIDELRAEDGLGNEDTKKTLLKVLLSLQNENPEYYTDEMIKSLSQALLHGGINTSVVTMEWAMSHLLNNPNALKKAQIEIDCVVGCDRLVNEADLLKLPYLQCIIKETVRMQPPSPLLLPHESSKECTVGGYRIPQGTMLLVNLWALQNDPNIWNSPETFKPERFEVIENIVKVKEGMTMSPFGSGRRRCPAENLAMRIVGLALASLIQCFDWKRVSEELVDMTESGVFSLARAQPLMAKFQTRSNLARHLFHV